jgi:hypothetical protein
MDTGTSRTASANAVILVLCPECSKPGGRRLPGVSAESIVDYYRCAACGNVWTHAKASEPDTPNVERRT